MAPQARMQLRHYGLFFLLAIFLDASQGASLRGCANLPRMMSIAQLAHKQSEVLLEFYVKEIPIDDISESHDNVPAATVSGSSPLEKLHSVSDWIEIFRRHLGNVASFFGTQEMSLVELRDAASSLAKLSVFVDAFLDDRSTTTVAVTTVPQGDDWSRMVYAYDVMFRLRDFLALVEPVLVELQTQGLCG